MALDNWQRYWSANPDLAFEYGRNNPQNLTQEQYANWHYNNYGQSEGRDPNGIGMVGSQHIPYRNAGGEYQGELGANTGHYQLPDGSWAVDDSSYWQRQGYAPGQTAFTTGDYQPYGGYKQPWTKAGYGGATTSGPVQPQQPQQPQVLPGVTSGDPFAGFRVEQLDPSRAFVTPGGISELLNPYQQQVRDQTMSDIERQRQLAQMTTDDQANAAKAFGGNRHGVANALTNDAFARESGRQYANLNQQGWNTAATLNQANAGNYLSGRGQDISQNQGFMQGALQQRQQDTGYAMGQTSNLINAFQVGNNLLNSSGNMDWNSLNQGSSAINGPSNQASTTQDGGSTWNNLFGNLLTGISLVYRG